MIIQCPKCGAKFRFPQSEFTGEGIWLKCGSCGNVFFLDNPGQAAPGPDMPGTEAPPGGASPEMNGEEDDIADGSRRPGKLLAVLSALGILLAVFLVTGGIYYFFFPEVGGRLLNRAAHYIPFSSQLGLGEKKPPAVQPGIDFLNVREKFVKNWVLGDIMVIQGIAVNKTDRNASLLKIKAKLLDPSGKFIAESSSYAGSTFTDEELTNLTEREITGKLSNTEGSEFPNRNIAPETSIPFVVVFVKPPPKASEYIVELESMDGLARKK